MRKNGTNQRSILGTKHDIFENGEGLNQHEMLVHHADPGLDRIGRRADGNRCAINANFPSIGLVEAEQDRHQCGFASPIFTDNAVNGALCDGEVDILVGMNRAETLVDADHLDRGGHPVAGLR